MSVTAIEDHFESTNCNAFKPGDVIINGRTSGLHVVHGLSGTVVAFNPTDPNFSNKPSIDVMFVNGVLATVACSAVRRA